MDIELPDRLYFKIGEVAELTGIKPHVLRYWESEFPLLRPVKSRKQQRLYRQADIRLVLRLKDLLYNQGFTIAGAKQRLQQPDPPAHRPEFHRPPIIEELRLELLRLRNLLNDPT